PIVGAGDGHRHRAAGGRPVLIRHVELSVTVAVAPCARWSKSLPGLNTSWFATTLALPWPLGALALTSVKAWPSSTSVSLASTSIVKLWFSVPAATSATATGPSLVP